MEAFNKNCLFSFSMALQYKSRCTRCKKNFQLITRPTPYVVCYECQKPEMQGEITDPEMKKMFDIPEQYYKDIMFLRDIKIKYLLYGNLSENQIEAFKKVVDKLEQKAKEEE